VRIDDGLFSLSGKPALEKVNLEVRDLSASSSFPFTFRAKKKGGGEVKLDGNAGPLPQGDASRIPFRAKLDVEKWNLDGAGLVSLDGNASSDGKMARFGGKLKAEQLKLADRGTPASKPVEFEFGADHRLADGSGRLTKGDLRIGGAAAKLGGSYATRGETTVLHMRLAGDRMPVPELAAMLPSLGVALPAGASLQGGTATVKLAMDGPASRLVTAGTVSVNDTTVGGFDLGRKMAVIQALAGIRPDANTKIQTLAGAVRMSHEGTTAENLQLVVPSIGDMAGAGTISPANALDFKMTAKVSGQSIPFLVTGTMADPSFRPDVKSVVTDTAKGLLKGLFNPKKN
jgi:AsmA protein